MESNDQLTVHPHSLRESWNQEILNHTRSLRALATARRTDYALVSTSDPYFALFDRLRD
jgi:site-specific recombinase XerC